MRGPAKLADENVYLYPSIYWLLGIIQPATDHTVAGERGQTYVLALCFKLVSIEKPGS